MSLPARLITPKGAIIELSPETYRLHALAATAKGRFAVDSSKTYVTPFGIKYLFSKTSSFGLAFFQAWAKKTENNKCSQRWLPK